VPSRAPSRGSDLHAGRLVGLLAAWWLWMPAGAVVIWLISYLLFGGYGQQAQGYVLFLQANLFPHNSLADPAPLFWIWAFVGLAGTLGITLVTRAHFRPRWPVALGGLVIVAAMGISFAYVYSGLWDHDKHEARYYAQGTVFYAPSVSPAPSSLRPLTDTALAAAPGSGCDYLGTADVPSCIRIGSMPDFNWAPRTASYEAAGHIMADSSALASQVNVMAPTVHYLPGMVSGQGVWTAILDGSGTRPTEGVAVWNGESNTVSICQFQGSDLFNRAFGGTGGDSLRNLIAQRFPSLVYTDHDVSGFCSGSGSGARPEIVIPVERQVGVNDFTVLEPAGILVLTGSLGGDPSMAYHPTVKAGQYPGQVYPLSIVKAQLAAAEWAAGRGNMDNAGFGYGLTSVDTNSFNPGEYVLRSNTDGHLYFVTPLTPRNSSSQAVVAYAVERADEVTSGLNPLMIYVEGDQANQTSMTVLESRMTTYINQVAPSLLASGSGGELLEIIPYGQSMWRGFVDIDGVTQDFIDMSSSGTITPSLVSLPGRLSGQGPVASGSPSSGSSPPPGGSLSSGCGGNPATMPTSKLAQCIQEFAKALSQRAQSPAPRPTR
jgi:hypothetical protein